MQKKVFKPKYSFGYLLGMAAIVLLEAFLLAELLLRPERSNALLAIPLGIFVASLPWLMVKRIVFEDYAFVVERYFLPPKTIEYQQVIGVGNTMIRTRQGVIMLRRMTNARELVAIMHALMAEGKISKDQVAGNLVRQEKLALRAVWISLPVAWVVEVIFSAVSPQMYAVLHDFWIFVFWVPIYLWTFGLLRVRSS